MIHDDIKVGFIPRAEYHDNLIINYKIIQEIKNGDNFNYNQIATFLQ